MTDTLTDSYHRTIDYLRISVTDRCNLRCSYCYVGEKSSVVMSEETARQAIDFLFSCLAGYD